ncbi:MAG: Fic family protein [Hyphomicrobiales bacterium]|nr:Fic family protein [Hyphomicrobiales bacterium]
MIHAYPRLDMADREALDMIREQRAVLKYQVNAHPVRWQGFLRRNTFARALQGSNSIEGINVSLAEAVAVVDDEKPETLEEETARALFGYRTAMTYIIRIHDDPHAEVNAQFIRSLHFMMLSYDMTMLPGQWRPGAIYVIRSPSDERVYEGPDAEQVPSLVDELVAQINSAEDIDSSTVLAAMAHLNLAMIHPFKDGNGRMARALQALVLARNGVVSPTFCSIEEWLGRNTEAYYNILAEVGQGKWSPQRDALPWVRFCLVAHYQQAATLIKRNAIIGRAWNEVARLRKQYGLLDRMELVLMDAIFGYRVRNQRHREHNELSEVVASRDLKRLTELGLLEAVGEKRGRYYVAAPPLKEIWKRSIDPTKAPNPYDILGVKNKSDFQLSLPV